MTYRQRKERKQRHKGKLRTKFILGFGVIIAVVLIGALSVVGYIVSIAATAPDINDLKPIDKGSSSEIFAADGSRRSAADPAVLRVFERLMQQQARLGPVALNGALRHLPHRGDLAEREAAEELEVDDLGEPGVDRRQRVLRVADPCQLLAVGHDLGHVGADRGDLELPATLLRVPAAHEVDDQPAHHA